MTANPPQAQAADAEGLLAIVACPIPPADVAGAVGRLCAQVARLVGAEAVAVVASGPDATTTLVAGWADPPELLDRIADGSSGGQVCVALAGGASAVALGIGHDAAPGARLALAVAGERILSATALARARADLDRTLAQVLESDERLVGRIGLDIHDGPTQHLSVGLLEVQLLQAQLDDAIAAGVVLPPGVAGSVERIYETLGGALTEMRELIGHLRPARFQGRRLTEILGDAVTRFEARSGLEVRYVTEGEFPVDGVSVTQRITFYRILQEALSNAQRHGNADDIRVEVREDAAGTTLLVADNGGGFDPAEFSEPAPPSSIARFGLHGMRDRAAMLGGTFSIDSTPGDGCTLRVWLPRWRPPEPTESLGSMPS